WHAASWASRSVSELHLRRDLDRLAIVTEVEERALREAEHAGEQHGREALDAAVVLAHRIVEEAARRRDLVLDIGELRLQLLEVRVRLQVRIALGQGEYLAQRAGELVLGGALRGRSLPGRRHRGVARLDDGFEGAAFVRRIAFHGLDQVRDQVVSLLELHVDVGERLIDALAHRDEAVVARDHDDREDDDDGKDDPAGGHRNTPFGVTAAARDRAAW